MQTAKNAAATAKEMAANTAASAKSGKDKTMATVQEKVERMKANDPVQKDMATERKQEKINQAECNKLGARENNAAARQAVATGGTGTFTAVGQAQNSTPGAGNQNYTAGGNNLGDLIRSDPTEYGAGQQTYGAQNSTPGAGNQNYTAGGNNPGNLTGGRNSDHITGSDPNGYGMQPNQNLGGVNLGGADAVYPDDPIGSGPNATRNTTDGAPGTGHGTGGTYL